MPVVTPTITEVKDLKGKPVPHGSTTVETSVTLSGLASKGLEVEIFDGTATKGKAPVDPVTGIWSREVTGLSVSEHRFTAKANYGASPVSEPWVLNVIAAGLPTEDFESGFSGDEGGHIRPGASRNFPTLVVLNVSAASVSFMNFHEQLEPYSSGRPLSVIGGLVKLTLKISVKRIKFGAVDQSAYTEAKVSYFDEQGAIVHQTPIQFRAWNEYTAPDLKRIKTIEIEHTLDKGQHVFFDKFTFTY
ncbi:hypothetical protein [Pseudomonas sp. P8_241]|uniref:hypothetical protein n=1 Tax=Pseudomonas sp. P8_241 TaxID=3043445 RepID=UPI002A362D08|nr:hypothetical protein [Pseudomonas sp. P8_241]WPN49351.1 hypothetical protein QMK58_12095 [Pseudomonas sp. P8_241]